MNNEVVKKSKIIVEVGLDESNVPIQINWMAEDNPEGANWQESKAILLSLFDKEHKDTIKIDLWTKEMQMVEMDRFFFQTLKALAETYQRSTNNGKLTQAMRQFVQYFGEETEIIPKN